MGFADLLAGDAALNARQRYTARFRDRRVAVFADKGGQGDNLITGTGNLAGQGRELLFLYVIEHIRHG